MEKQRQSWCIKYVEDQFWFVLGDYWVNAGVVERHGIDYWVRHIKEKNPAWDWIKFEKICRKHFS